MGRGNESFFAASGSLGSCSTEQFGERWQLCPYMTEMATKPIYGKNPLKIFFSETKGPIALGLGMQHLGHWPNEV